jgi:geranylgeranyl reductase family protein
MKEYEVIVIGSGPSGSSAAYVLAEKGYRILLIEKEKLPRYKTCGGGVVYRAKKLLPFDISEISELECCQSKIFDLPIGFHYSSQREPGMVTMTMRSQLDFQFVSKCKKAGTEVIEECEVKDVIFQKENISVKTKKENFNCKFLIAADGVNSVIAKKAGFKESRKTIPALEYEVYVDSETYNRFANAARFDFGVVPKGYAWVFPKKDHLSIGVLSMWKNGRNLNKSFNEYLNILAIKKIIRSERHGYKIPVKPRKGSLVKNRVLLVGDAAGLTDPVTAEGISYAIMSGQLAAKAIIEGKFIESEIEKIYNTEIQQQIINDINKGIIISYLIYRFDSIRHFFLKFYGDKLSELITDVIMGDRNYEKLVSNPYNYLKLIFPFLIKNKANKGKSMDIPLTENIQS